jgi:SAM-dependent methyltransferase
MRVLDVGSGLGGPARFIAENFGCFVTGVDLSEAFVEAARYLTERTGQTDHVTFKVGDALDLPVNTGEFDIAIQQHVAMNIADRPALYREMYRILKPGGRFAIYDVILTGGDPIYPLPWATSAEGSFLMSATDTCIRVEEAGFRTVFSRDDNEAAKAWISKLQSSGPVPPPNLGTVMGLNFGELATNLGRALLQGRLGLLMAVFEVQ